MTDQWGDENMTFLPLDPHGTGIPQSINVGFWQRDGQSDILGVLVDKINLEHNIPILHWHRVVFLVPGLHNPLCKLNQQS